MNSNLHSNRYPCAEDSFEHFGILFDSPVINNTITLPPKKGNGIIKKIDAANGLTIYLWDVQLHETLHLERTANKPGSKNSFSLFYIFSPAYLTITKNDNDSYPNLPLKNIVFASDGVSLDFLVKPWQSARMIQIEMTREWLMNEYEHSGLSTCPAYNNFLNNSESVLFTELATFDTCHTFANMVSHINRESSDSFYLKAKTLSLLCDIFILAGKQQSAIVSENNTLIQEKMLAVEKILDDCLETTLPSIASIAKQMALSESTLKRNFKQLYGTSIYEYYLQKKMKKAREIFSESPIPVKEVAYRLGYEKVSNFI
ncbi:MAG: AraC family transcriptional regulator, partial [Chitinophagaceae bacterium]